jgi:transposase
MNAVPLDHWPEAVAGDKGYSAGRIRRWLDQRSIEDVVPYKSNEFPPEDHEFDRQRYRDRNIVERLIGWLKECRRIATRFEKRGKHFLAMIKLAALRRLVRFAT